MSLTVIALAPAFLTAILYLGVWAERLLGQQGRLDGGTGRSTQQQRGDRAGDDAVDGEADEAAAL